MNLQDFLSESLVQVCNGIRDAQNRVNEKTVSDEKYFQPIIVPSPINSPGPSPRDNYFFIDFDLAVTVEEKANAIGKFNIAVVGVSVDLGQIKEIKTNSLVSRMKFSIPVIYPSVPKPYSN